MKEESDVEENIESSTFGTNIHEVLERIMLEGFGVGEEAKPLNSEIIFMGHGDEAVTVFR